ncbi:MAG: hypothetical protein JW682_02755 [Campylobacterales bacterium]|nr:hypothetical protein [Campylobacterales bacterium]
MSGIKIAIVSFAWSLVKGSDTKVMDRRSLKRFLCLLIGVLKYKVYFDQSIVHKIEAIWFGGRCQYQNGYPQKRNCSFSSLKKGVRSNALLPLYSNYKKSLPKRAQ